MHRYAGVTWLPGYMVYILFYFIDSYSNPVSRELRNIQPVRLSQCVGILHVSIETDTIA